MFFAIYVDPPAVPDPVLVPRFGKNNLLRRFWMKLIQFEWIDKQNNRLLNVAESVAWSIQDVRTFERLNLSKLLESVVAKKNTFCQLWPLG